MNEILVALPTYNNGSTLAEVLERVQKQGLPVLVVNDGSTDQTAEVLKSFPDIHVVTHETNKGKGAGLRTAFDWAYEQGYRYVITIDSDGQHYPEDIPLFVRAIEQTPDTLLVGSRDIEAENMPAQNTFANKTSNFWFTVSTGVHLPDTQTGFRLYPIRRLRNLKLISGKYEFEMEILVRAIWRDIPVRPIPVRVYYAPGEERVSHFRPLQDFLRIVGLNILLVLIAIFWFYPSKLLKRLQKK